MLGTQAAGGIASAFGAAASASVQKMGYKLDATLSRINADKARDSAREVLREGYQAEVRQRLQTGQLKGAQRAAMGANNVDMTTGSALNRLVSTDYMGEADAQTIRLNAARAAMGYRDQAVNFDNKALIDKATASGINPFLTGATSLLGSAASIASNWYGMDKLGMFDKAGGSGGKLAAPDASYDFSQVKLRYGTFG
jgi:hypothetical protein